MGPVLRLGSPGAGMNRQDGVAGVAFPREKHLDSELAEGSLKICHLGMQLFFEVGVAALFGELRHRHHIGMPALDVFPALDCPLHRSLLSAGASSSLRVFPEVRLGGFLFEGLQLRGELRQVKDAPAVH